MPIKRTRPNRRVRVIKVPSVSRRSNTRRGGSRRKGK